MKKLTEEEVRTLVSDNVADYENEISLFVPLTGDEPVIMYTSTVRGVPSMHYLSVNIKRKYAGGLYVYSPKKPFDIKDYKFSDESLTANLNGENVELEVTYYDSYHHVDDTATAQINKQDSIAIAKALGVTGEDLL